jgi:hypothetical protein
MSENENDNENYFGEIDLGKLHALLKEVESRVQADEVSRRKSLDEQELEELSRLPRGPAGLRLRSNVNAKYQILRYGARANGSLDWLNGEREKKKLAIPDTDNEYELMAAYQRAIAPWRGNVRRISIIQAQFRAKGLNV